MHSEVVWANGTEGVNGRDEVGLYWKRQSAIIDPHVEPLGFQLKRSVYEEQLLAILRIVFEKEIILKEQLAAHCLLQCSPARKLPASA